MSCKVELVEKKNLLIKLEASKMSIKDLFKDLLDEIKGFKYQVTVKTLLRKDKQNGETEFALVYFNSTTKTVINHKFDLDESFQEILYRIDNWTNEESCWIFESISPQYINISTYRLLIGSSFVKLPVELRNPKNGLINIKNNDQKCFLWCHVRHIHPVKIHPERITQEDKEFVNDLNYNELNFLCQKKFLVNLKRKTTFVSMFFVMEIN